MKHLPPINLYTEPVGKAFLKQHNDFIELNDITMWVKETVSLQEADDKINAKQGTNSHCFYQC